MTPLRIVPVSFREAGAFVAEHHRTHRRPPPGHKFSVGLATGDELVGIAMIGRPVARHFDDGLTLEVNRTCIAGTVPNGNSMLLGAAWRAAKALGYLRLITYTQAGESGVSLRAAGWRVVAHRPARKGWDRPLRPRRADATANIQRTLWEAARDTHPRQAIQAGGMNPLRRCHAAEHPNRPVIRRQIGSSAPAPRR